MTDARDRPRPGRLAGRGPDRREARRVLDARPHAARRRRALPVSLRLDDRPAAPRPAARPRRPAPGVVLGLPRRLRRDVPRRASACSSGSGTGVLLAQQTAANLHAKPGDTMTIGRAGGRPAAVKVDGVVDLPTPTRCSSRSARRRRPAASATRQRGPAAARDVRHASSAGRPSRRRSTRGLVPPRCPAAPAPPSRRCRGNARNLETRLAGAGLVGDNLGTALDKAREDALYAAAAVPVPRRPGRGARRPAHRLDRRRRRRPPPPRRRAAAHARRLHPPARRARARARPRSPAGVGVARRPRRRADRSARRRSAPRASAPRRSPPSLWAVGAALAGPADRRRRRSRCPPGATPAR